MLGLLLICTVANAQFNYDLSVRQETYQPLTNSTNINGTNVWDDTTIVIPLGFTYHINGIPVTDFIFLDGMFVSTDTQNTVSMFWPSELDLIDRGYNTGISKSPINYTISGTSPNRIFKLEVENAGIYEEYDIYGTLDDSTSIQIWLYESGSIFEIHYGPSELNHTADYFATGYPIVGFFKDINTSSGNIILDMLYYLIGPANNPVMDSTRYLGIMSNGLNSYPNSGTVYRFAPRPVSVNGVAKGAIDISMVSNKGSDKVIVNNGSESTANYSVLNVSGAAMNVSGSLSKGNNDIDISSLSAGMYLLNIQTPNGQKAYRILKY